ncbi:hypothetical protein [Trujillonella humicola]|uniref:hypothetical protein n=1 Tax=Trujillonella humicola TaxID=3383699 RepID=UPI0039069785
MTDIRLVSASPWEQDLFVVGEFERMAHVLSVSKAAVLASVDTVLDYGGRRLALISAENPVIVAGAWARHGVCGYSLAGVQLWQNESRSGVQQVTALAAGTVAVAYEKGPAVVLDGSSGEQVSALPGVRGVHALTPSLSLLEGSGYMQLADGNLQSVGDRISLRSFGVLDAAADAEHVAVAEAGGPLRILTLAGVERATHLVPGGRVVAVAYEAGTGTWRAVSRVDREDDVHHELLRLSDDADVLERQKLTDLIDAAWLRDGTALAYATPAGVRVRDDADGMAQQVGDIPPVP